ncbi:MAG: hypothetical protein ACFUZC_03410 [Chthoniobacteraceae bacterium]
MLAAAIVGLIAFAGNSHAQTATTGSATAAATASPTPDPNAGTFRDTTLSVPQRIQLANAVLSSGTDASTVFWAANYMLGARPVVHLVTAFPAFADSVITDPTLSGKLDTQAPTLLASAITFKTDAIAALDDKIAYISSQFGNTLLDEPQTLRLKSKYGGLVAQKAQKLYDTQDYAGAVATATPVLGFGGSPSEISVIFRSKLALRSPDVLSWAKLVYLLQGFGQTQSGIDAISSAYRSLDTNLVRANAFIQYQKDGAGTNPIASVQLPSVKFISTSSSAQALNKSLAGDSIGALKIAVNAFASAPSGTQLNNATAFVAQWLRNNDGNLVRANNFVSAQSQGQTYTIAELQSGN